MFGRLLVFRVRFLVGCCSWLDLDVMSFEELEVLGIMDDQFLVEVWGCVVCSFLYWDIICIDYGCLV